MKSLLQNEELFLAPYILHIAIAITPIVGSVIWFALKYLLKKYRFLKPPPTDNCSYVLKDNEDSNDDITIKIESNKKIKKLKIKFEDVLLLLEKLKKVLDFKKSEKSYFSNDSVNDPTIIIATDTMADQSTVISETFKSTLSGGSNQNGAINNKKSKPLRTSRVRDIFGKTRYLCAPVFDTVTDISTVISETRKIFNKKYLIIY